MTWFRLLVLLMGSRPGTAAKEVSLSERNELYPQPTPEVAARRSRLAPGPADRIRGHTRAALRQGATPEEIMEAIWVATEMRAGGACAHSALALDEIAAHEAGTQP